MTENWVGAPDATAEHRTTGGRAWCFNDGEWCSAASWCQCCDVTRVPDHWKGLYAGELLDELREQVQTWRDIEQRETNNDPTDWYATRAGGAAAAFDAVLKLFNGGAK
jgi:hypothetical protein